MPCRGMLGRAVPLCRPQAGKRQPHLNDAGGRDFLLPANHKQHVHSPQVCSRGSSITMRTAKLSALDCSLTLL